MMEAWDGFYRAQREYEYRLPPEPVECCSDWEDPEHDWDACLADSAEAAAEAKAEQAREDEMWGL